MRFSRGLRAGAVVAAAAMVLAACGGDDDDSDDGGAASNTERFKADVADVSPEDFPEGSTMRELAEAGTITVGTKFDQPLFGMMTPAGAPVGFDVHVAEIIAGKLGIEPKDIEWVESPSASREAFIVDGKVDIVVATYTINDDRKELVDFAGPYYHAGQAIMVRADEEGIEGPEDLAGKKVCTVEGSTPEKNMEENYPEAELETTDVYGKCLDPLRDGEFDAMTTDDVILAGYVNEAPEDFKIVGDTFTDEPYGIGVAKGDDEFRDWINDALEEAFSDGSWEAAWKATAGRVIEVPEAPEVDRY